MQKWRAARFFLYSSLFLPESRGLLYINSTVIDPLFASLPLSLIKMDNQHWMNYESVQEDLEFRYVFTI
jgi:hypothetical protein